MIIAKSWLGQNRVTPSFNFGALAGHNSSGDGKRDSNDRVAHQYTCELHQTDIMTGSVLPNTFDIAHCCDIERGLMIDYDFALIQA